MWLNRNKATLKSARTSSNVTTSFRKRPATTGKVKKAFLTRYLQHANLKKVEETSKPFSQKIDLLKLIKDPSKFDQEVFRDQLVDKDGPLAKEMKTVRQIVNALPRKVVDDKDYKNFDEFVSSLLKKHGVSKEDIQKEATLFYNGNESKAKLKIAKRLAYHLQGGIDPAKHSPARAAVAEQTEFPASVVKAAEKAFKHQIRDNAEPHAIDVKESDHTYRILASGKELIIELKELGGGTYKTVNLAFDFTNLVGDLVTLAPHKTYKPPESEEESIMSYGPFVQVEREPTTAEKEALELMGKVDGKYDLTQEEEYAKEIKRMLQLQGDGVVEMHKVITLESNQVMVQKAAGYKIGDKTIIDLQELEDFELQKGLDAKDQGVKYQALHDVMIALNRMHEEFNLIHRDVKHLNVLITSQGRGALTDFGTVIEDKDVEEATFVGTPNFAPPESAVGENITKKFDVWSIGMMVYSLCCEGKKLEDHPIFDETMRALKEEGQLDLEETLFPEQMAEGLALVNSEKYENLWGDIKTKFSGKSNKQPESFEELVYLCTQFDPEKRPTMSEVLKSFKEIAQKKGISIRETF